MDRAPRASIDRHDRRAPCLRRNVPIDKPSAGMVNNRMTTERPFPLRPEAAALLVVDFQEKLLPAIHEGGVVVEAARRMIESAGVLGLPVLVTEQYPAGLGRTCDTLRSLLAAAPLFEKLTFSACVPDVKEHLERLGRRNIVVVGIETHVCVQQTVLELLALGYLPWLCADATGSRRPLDRDTALAGMARAGAIVTTAEAVIFEMLGQAGTDAFKRILRIVK